MSLLNLLDLSSLTAALPAAPTASPVAFATTLGLVVLSVGLVLSFVRFALGPTLPDRVVALDTLATLLVGLLVLEALAEPRSESLRVATVLALVNFLGTVAFAIYLRKKTMQ